jgi:hypothetical protein
MVHQDFSDSFTGKVERGFDICDLPDFAIGAWEKLFFTVDLCFTLIGGGITGEVFSA